MTPPLMPQSRMLQDLELGGHDGFVSPQQLPTQVSAQTSPNCCCSLAQLVSHFPPKSPPLHAARTHRACGQRYGDADPLLTSAGARVKPRRIDLGVSSVTSKSWKDVG